jgi:uncharacterized membrane protein YkoI
MKKILFISAAFVGMLFVTSCSNSDDPVTPTPPSPYPGKTYLEVMMADVNTALATYPEFKKQGEWEYPYGYMREANYELNGNVSDTPLNELKAVQVSYGFAYVIPGTENTMVILEAYRDFRQALDREMAYQKIESPGYPLDLDIIENLDQIMSLEQAIQIAKNSGIKLPKTSIVRLRKQVLLATKDRTCYRFDVGIGDQYIIYVDAVTGEIIKAENK